MKLLDEFAPQALEALFEELVEKAIFMAAVNEPGRRYGDPVRQFYAGPPLDAEYFSSECTGCEPSYVQEIVSVNINSQEVSGSREAIVNMTRQECMQKYIAQQIRDHADRVVLALFKGETK